MNLYPSNLARDAALDAMPAAAWTQDYRTFEEFTAQLDRLLPFSDRETTARRDVQGVGRLALLAQAMRQDAGELERVAGSERALNAAGALIASWKGASLRPDDVRAAAADLGARADSARVGGIAIRLARLYELYERKLGNRWTDRESGERVLLRRLEACERIPARLLKPGEQVVLHGFHKLAYVQFRIVQKLIRLKHDVAVVTPIFSQSGAAEKKFAGLIKTFGSARFESAPKMKCGAKCIQRMAAPSPYAEVYEIGRRVRRWITEENIPASSIAISFRDLGPYSQAIHDVFKRLEISFYERRGEPAQFQPLVRTALSGIDACVSGLDRRSVFRFLCAGPVDVAALAGMNGARIDPDALRAFALEAGIDRMHSTAAENPAAAWTKKLRRFLPAEANARALVAIVEPLSAMRGDRTVHAHVQAWRALFDVCGLNAAKISASDNATAKERLALNALDAALVSVAEIPDAATENITLDAFAELLNMAIQEQSVRADGTDRAGVCVLNFYDLRGLSFARLVIGGLAEGLCPARPGGDPLLGQGGERALRDALAERVNDREAGAYLAPRLSHENEEEERALFESALACAHGGVLLARPQRGFDGGTLGASEYWNEFQGAVEQSTAIHPAPTLSECLTAGELELRAAWVLGGGVSLLGNEPGAALAAFERTPRLKELARFAAVERSRYQFFLDQAIAAAQHERGADDVKKTVTAGTYDGIVAALSTCGATTATCGAASGTFSEIATDVAKRLAPGGIGDPMLGPSDLEKLAACPFRFLLERACRFDQVEEPGREISLLDSGNLWHSVLNRFYKEELDRATAAGRLTARLDRTRRDAYLNRLLFFAGEELFKTASEKFTGHPGFWKLQEERVRALLATWLDCELQEPADGFFPARVEFEFGPEAAGGGRELKVPLNSSGGGAAMALRIKGRMDRLDFKTEERGGTETIVAVRVIDYKLGRGKRYAGKTKPESMSEMLSAQLPIYVAAAMDYLFTLRDEKKIAVDFERVWSESRAGYYSLRDTPFSSRNEKEKLTLVKEWPLGDLKTFLDTSAPGALFDLARIHIAETLSGRFPVQPLDCTGLYCPARYACRYQAIPALEEED